MADAPLQSTEERPYRRVPAVLGLIGTLTLCAAAMMAHLSPTQAKPIVAAMWILGFATQAFAFILALRQRHTE